jgi:hypothetical protein
MHAGDPILRPAIAPHPQSLAGDFQIAESVDISGCCDIRITGHDDEMAESW